MACESAVGSDRFRPALERGLDFYRNDFFLKNGAPKWTSDRVLPHDVHGSSQGILTFSLAGDPAMALRIARWALDHFYKGHGEFSYQIGRFVKKRFSLLHWCDGWMSRGLAALIASQTQGG